MLDLLQSVRLRPRADDFYFKEKGTLCKHYLN
jgi:hypothetical protein